MIFGFNALHAVLSVCLYLELFSAVKADSDYFNSSLTGVNILGPDDWLCLYTTADRIPSGDPDVLSTGCGNSSNPDTVLHHIPGENFPDRNDNHTIFTLEFFKSSGTWNPAYPYTVTQSLSLQGFQTCTIFASGSVTVAANVTATNVSPWIIPATTAQFSASCTSVLASISIPSSASLAIPLAIRPSASLASPSSASLAITSSPGPTEIGVGPYNLTVDEMPGVDPGGTPLTTHSSPSATFPHPL